MPLVFSGVVLPETFIELEASSSVFGVDFSSFFTCTVRMNFFAKLRVVTVAPLVLSLTILATNNVIDLYRRRRSAAPLGRSTAPSGDETTTAPHRTGERSGGEVELHDFTHVSSVGERESETTVSGVNPMGRPGIPNPLHESDPEHGRGDECSSVSSQSCHERAVSLRNARSAQIVGVDDESKDDDNISSISSIRSTAQSTQSDPSTIGARSTTMRSSTASRWQSDHIINDGLAAHDVLAFNIFLTLTYLVYPVSSVTVFSALTCDSDFDGDLRFLYADYSLSCSWADPRYRAHATWAIFCLFVYPFGIPALYLYYLYCNNHLINPIGQQRKLSKDDMLLLVQRTQGTKIAAVAADIHELLEVDDLSLVAKDLADRREILGIKLRARIAEIQHLSFLFCFYDPKRWCV